MKQSNNTITFLSKALRMTFTFVLCTTLTSCYNPSTITPTTHPEATIHETEGINIYTDDCTYPVKVNEYSDSGVLLREITYDQDETGEVFERERYEYHYDTNENLILVTRQDTSMPEPTEYLSYVYDDKERMIASYRYGELKSETSYDSQGQLLSKKIYDSSGTVIGSEEYRYSNGKTFISRMTESEYEDIYGNVYDIPYTHYSLEEINEEGKTTKITYYEPNREPYYEVYTYSSTQLICEAYLFTGELDYSHTTSFDEFGRRTRFETIYSDGSFSFTTYEYTDNTEVTYDYSDYDVLSRIDKIVYDDSGRISYEAVFDGQWNLQRSWTYTYDSHGYIVQILIENSDGTTEKELAPERKFDTNGTLVKGKRKTYWRLVVGSSV